jgi:hypothetical protein
VIPDFSEENRLILGRRLRSHLPTNLAPQRKNRLEGGFCLTHMGDWSRVLTGTTNRKFPVMPTITVNGFSKYTDRNSNFLIDMRGKICEAVIGVKVLGITHWKDIETYFPTEINTSANKGEISIRVSELWKKPERTKKVQDKLAAALVKAVCEIMKEWQYEGKEVCCFIDPLFDTKKQGFCHKVVP